LFNPYIPIVVRFVIPEGVELYSVTLINEFVTFDVVTTSNVIIVSEAVVAFIVVVVFAVVETELLV
jgi:hypothetical protein